MSLLFIITRVGWSIVILKAIKLLVRVWSSMFILLKGEKKLDVFSKIAKLKENGWKRFFFYKNNTRIRWSWSKRKVV